MAGIICCQVPLCTGSYFCLSSWNLEGESKKEPQEWKAWVVFLAVFVNLAILLLILLLTANISLQIRSFLKLISFLTTNNVRKCPTFIIISILTVLYFHDALLMLLYAWGLPGFFMTQPSRNNKGQPINTYQFCTYNINSEENASRKQMIIKSIWNSS